MDAGDLSRLAAELQDTDASGTPYSLCGIPAELIAAAADGAFNNTSHERSTTRAATTNGSSGLEQDRSKPDVELWVDTCGLSKADVRALLLLSSANVTAIHWLLPGRTVSTDDGSVNWMTDDMKSTTSLRELVCAKQHNTRHVVHQLSTSAWRSPCAYVEGYTKSSVGTAASSSWQQALRTFLPSVAPLLTRLVDAVVTARVVFCAKRAELRWVSVMHEPAWAGTMKVTSMTDLKNYI